MANTTYSQVQAALATYTAAVDALTNTFVADNAALAQAVTDAQTAESGASASAADASTDATATAADRVQTGNDAIATAADRVQTGLDAAAAAASATDAANAVSSNWAIKMNAASITADLSITAGFNALSVGPIGIADGVTVDVADTSRWAIV